ncbi:MAG: Rpn family recombination-promoting nuclease/putative transposase [Lachnospiraceae bacterium]|nr:Rpn family recombination-promoting nuclease/putative transposase [Lachnospiraceae bacterium]
MEHQEHIHYAMPMRVMGYDYGVYKKQYDSNARKYRTATGMEEDEYMSGMKKTDRFTPVIMMVVYYGEKPWSGAVSLHGMLKIPQELKAFVNDYKFLLVEARENRLVLHNVKNVDFFNLMGMILDKSLSRNETRKKAIDYAREHKVDKSVLMTVAGAANCKINYNALSRKGDFTMWSFFEEIAKEGEAKGIIETGLEFNLSEKDILERLQKKLNLSLQMAQEYFKMFGKRTV